MNPFAIKQVIVPIDLSHTSLNTLDTAVTIAREHDASLLLLNIIEPDFAGLTDEYDFYRCHLSNSSDVLTALAGSIQYTSRLKPKIIQVEGNVAETIIKSSLLHQSDPIVMDTHGASGFRNGFIGSNTYSVLKHSVCPVLTVRLWENIVLLGNPVSCPSGQRCFNALRRGPSFFFFTIRHGCFGFILW